MADQLWAVHVEGPDDVLACASREAAEAEAAEINEWWAAHWAERPGISLSLHAVAEPWPFSDGDHAAGLARREEEREWGSGNG